MVCCIGSLGKTGFAGRPLVTNQQINSVVFDQSEVLPRYGFHACRILRSRLEAMAPATTVAIVSKTRFAALTIPVPPLLEQHRIAEILDKADALRAKRCAAIAQLDTLTQAIFLDMFGDPMSNPNGWTLTPVGEVGEVQGGLQVTAARKSCPIEVPYLRVANVHRESLDLREIKTIRATEPEIRRTTLQEGDLLVVEGHGNAQELGRAALWDGSIPECVHQNHLIRVRFDTTRIAPRFASAYLNSLGGRRHLLRAGNTTSGLNTISVSDVRLAPVAVPPKSLQDEFAHRLETVDQLRSVQSASGRQLDALFASLQHRAFRGELWG